MSDPDQLGCVCGEKPGVTVEDGAAMRWWTPSPASMSTYQSPWKQKTVEPMMCAAHPPDVSFLFHSCLAPRRGLTEQDFAEAAATLGVEVASIKAVAEVETQQAAFDGAGRPTVLYERHRFRRFTGGKYDSTHPDISGPPYASGRDKYGALSKQYVRLADAYDLDPWAALQAASWGRFQVMGEHYWMLGYQSPQHMALAFSRSERAHLDGFVAYVLNVKSCHKGLKGKDWALFAAGFNGRDYAQNKYDSKLLAAYSKFSKPLANSASETRDESQRQARSP